MIATIFIVGKDDKNQNDYLRIDDELDLSSETIDVAFGGSVMFQLRKTADMEYVISNAVNGYGNNCLDQYKDYVVYVVPKDSIVIRTNYNEVGCPTCHKYIGNDIVIHHTERKYVADETTDWDPSYRWLETAKCKCGTVYTYENGT